MIDALVERQMSYKKQDQPEVALILDDILGSLKPSSRASTGVYVLVNPALYIRMYKDSIARHLLAWR
jgi:hypothetical protein